MCIQKKDAFNRTLLRSGMLICLFLVGCGNRYYYLGHAHMKKGLYDRAILDFNKALEIDPEHAMAYNNRGYAYNAKGLYDLAISDLNKALEINPRYADAYNNRGHAYYNKQEYDKAWEDVHKTQDLGSQVHPEYLNDLREASEREEGGSRTAPAQLLN